MEGLFAVVSCRSWETLPLGTVQLPQFPRKGVSPNYGVVELTESGYQDLLVRSTRTSSATLLSVSSFPFEPSWVANLTVPEEGKLIFQQLSPAVRYPCCNVTGNVCLLKIRIPRTDLFTCIELPEFWDFLWGMAMGIALLNCCMWEFNTT